MSYRCPACDAPQADGEHLANHLALTALTRGGEHEEWLDEQAPGWGDDDPAELATRVVDRAEETDAEPSSHAHDESIPTDRGPRPSAAGDTGSQFDGVVDAAVERVLDEARELTEEMFEVEDDESATGDGENRAAEAQDE